MRCQPGVWISIEGVEGVGKTTHISTLQSFIEKKLKAPVLITREPGGTWYAEKIRELLLLKSDEEVLHPDTELLLMFASRAQHYHAKILPALASGCYVICSRFTDSSLAYQGGGRGIALARIQALADWTLKGAEPDLTFLLDMPVEQGLARAKARAELDRIEQENIDFFERVRQVYLQLASHHPKRFEIIDASQSLGGVKEQIERACERRLR